MKRINYIDKLPEIKIIAQKRGGICLSENYINNRELILFSCNEGHRWETSWKNINKGAWCPECAKIKSRSENNSRFDSIKNMCKIAEERGGKCLSSEYLGSHIKLKWACNLGHEWITKPNAIKNGTWCPTCSEGIGERTCRFIFESLFKASFVKVRPDWLKNELTKYNLELDGYCEKLGIAFEYNGAQHYRDTNIYTRSKYDVQKLQLCQTANVKLFIIKEVSNILKYQEMIEEIRIQAINFNIEVNCDIPIHINELYKTSESVLQLKEIKKIAKLRGGACLSNNYIDSNFKLDFKCGICQFIWSTSPSSIKRGAWCHNCANKIKSIDDAAILAKNKNGKCLSSNYIDSITKMQWECELGHQWQASYNQIQSGSWCPECFKINRGKSKKIGIDVYRQIAINKGGECLSAEINSCYDKLEWKCKEGHTWLARGDLIKNTKQWCPQCAKDNKRKLK